MAKTSKLGLQKVKRGILIALLAIIAVCCAALGLNGLIPKRTSARADEEVKHEWAHTTESEALTATGGAIGAADETKHYHLDDNVKLSANLTIAGDVELCLNGYMLTGTGTGSVITVPKGASLSLFDCENTDSKATHYYTKETIEHKNTVGYNVTYLIDVYSWSTSNSSGAVLYKGGVITGGSNTNGGGIYIDGGTLNLHAGTISANTSTHNPTASNTNPYGGGGVFMASGAVNMDGGNIFGNQGYDMGGGVRMDAGTFTMTGGEISYNWNRHPDSEPYGGGGVFVNGGTFTLDGGKIHHNAGSRDGGGTYVNGGAFIMESGEITDNTVLQNNGGAMYVRLADNTFTMNGGLIENNSAGQGGAFYVQSTATNTKFTINGGEICGNTTRTGAGAGVYTGAGTTDINGGLLHDNTAGTQGGFIYQAGGTLNINGGEIYNNSASTHGGAIYMNSGTFNMYGGKLYNNTSKGTATVTDNATGYGGVGGAAWLGGAVNIYDGEIYGNTAEGKWNPPVTTTNPTKLGAYGAGGAFFVNGNTCTVKGGYIHDNTAYLGGAMYINGGTLSVSGGEIANNHALKTIGTETAKASGHGGGVYMNGGAMTHSGGAIINNDAAVNGGGVYFPTAATSTYNVSGTAQIYGNTAASKANNYYLEKGKQITIYNSFKTGALVGITLASDYGEKVAFTKGYSTHNRVAPDNYMFVDMLTKSGETYLGNVRLEGNEVIVDNTMQAHTHNGAAYQGSGVSDVADIKYVSGGANNYYLNKKDGAPTTYTGDITVGKDQKIELCLFGNSLTGNITVAAGGELILHDCQAGKITGVVTINGTATIDGAIITNPNANSTTQGHNGGSGVWVASTGKLTLAGSATVTGNKAVNGAGIYVDGGSLVIKEGASVTSNTATLGGGIYMNGGRLEMTNGTVAMNSAHNGAGIYSKGATLVLSGGTLNANSAKYEVKDDDGNVTAKNPAFGGGAYLEGGTATINGGSFTGNTATSGGALYIVSGASASMIAGAITNNTVTGVKVWKQDDHTTLEGGAGVFVSGVSADKTPSKFTMSGGFISSNTVSSSEDFGGAILVANGASFILSDGTIGYNVIVNNATYYGNKAYNGGAVAVFDGSMLMEGGKLVQNSAEFGGGGIYVDNGKLDITGGSLIENKVTINISGSGGAGAYVCNGTVMNMSGGIFTGGNSARNASGVLVTGETTKFYMSGGSLTNGNAMWGAVAVYDAAYFEMSGSAKITNNHASSTSGAVEIDSHGHMVMKDGEISGNWVTGNNTSGVRLHATDLFEMSGGIITGNIGGSAVTNYGTMIMTGGEIIDNYTGTSASTVGVGAIAGSELIISGDVKIYNNTKDNSGSNLYLNVGVILQIANHGLDEGAKIGITLANDYGTGAFTTGLKNGEEKYFFSDDNTKVIGLDKSGQAILVAREGEIPEVTYEKHYHDDTEFTAIQTIAPVDGVITLSSGKYYLAGFVPHNIVITGTVELCLNGKTISANGGSVITVNTGANFTLHDCVGTGKVTGGTGTKIDDPTSTATTKPTFVVGGGMLVWGTMVMNGGNIVNNTATTDDATTPRGAGAGVMPGASLTMNGGSISDNVTAHAAGVYVLRGSFKMDGTAVVSNNLVNTVGAGGGVGVTGTGATFIMQGNSKITGNEAYHDAGGLYLGSGATGTIGGNAEISYNKTHSWGGGIEVYSGATLTMNSGKVIGNFSPSSTSGMIVNGAGTFIMNGGEFSENVGSSTLSGANGGPKLEIHGGKIINNTIQYSSYNGSEADLHLGALVIEHGTIVLDGEVTIDGNVRRDGTQGNLVLGFNSTNNPKVEIGAAGLKNTSKIGVSAFRLPAERATAGYQFIENGDSATDYRDIFFSDDGNYCISTDGTIAVHKTGTVNTEAGIKGNYNESNHWYTTTGELCDNCKEYKLYEEHTLTEWGAEVLGEDGKTVTDVVVGEFTHKDGKYYQVSFCADGCGYVRYRYYTLSDIAVEYNGKTKFEEGEKFDASSLKVTAYYTAQGVSGSIPVVLNAGEYSISYVSGGNSFVVGKSTDIKVSYTAGSVTLERTITGLSVYKLEIEVVVDFKVPEHVYDVNDLPEPTVVYARYGTTTLEGSIAWYDQKGNKITSSTVLTPNASYTLTWKWTPADSKYETVSGNGFSFTVETLPSGKSRLDVAKEDAAAQLEAFHKKLSDMLAERDDLSNNQKTATQTALDNAKTAGLAAIDAANSEAEVAQALSDAKAAMALPENVEPADKLYEVRESAKAKIETKLSKLYAAIESGSFTSAQAQSLRGKYADDAATAKAAIDAAATLDEINAIVKEFEGKQLPDPDVKPDEFDLEVAKALGYSELEKYAQDAIVSIEQWTVSDAQKAVMKAQVESDLIKAKGYVDAATDADGITAAIARGKALIDLSDEKGEAKYTLDKALEALKTALESKSLTPEQKKSITDDFASQVADAKAQIEVATSAAKIKEIVESVGVSIPDDPDAPIPAPPVVNDDLAAAKADAKAKLERYAEEVKGRVGDSGLKSDIDGVVTKYKGLIGASTVNDESENGIQGLLKAAKGEIDKLVQEAEDAEYELYLYKEAAKAKLESALEETGKALAELGYGANSDVYKDFANKIKAGKDAIDAATDKGEIDAIVKALVDDYELPDPEDPLLEDKAKAKVDLQKYVEGVISGIEHSDELSPDVQKEAIKNIKEVLAAAEKAIEAAETRAEIVAAGRNGIAAIDLEVAKAQGRAEIDKALENAYKKVNALVDGGMSSEDAATLRSQIEGLADAAKKDVLAATSEKEIDDIVKAFVEGVVGGIFSGEEPDARLAAEKAKAMAELDRYAKEQLDSYVTGVSDEVLKEMLEAEVTAAKNAAKNAVSAAEDQGALTAALNKGKAAIDLAKKKAFAKRTLDVALETAKEQIAAADLTTAEKNDLIKDYTAKVVVAKGEIDGVVANTQSEVTACEGKIEDIVTKLVGDFKIPDAPGYVEPDPDEPPFGEDPEVASAKVQAKAELEEYVKQLNDIIDGRTDLSEAQKQSRKNAVKGFYEEGVKAIDAATTVEGVAEALATAKEAMGDHADKLYAKRVEAKGAIEDALAKAAVTDEDVKQMLADEAEAAKKAIDVAQSEAEINEIVALFKAKVEEAETNGALAKAKAEAKKALDEAAQKAKDKISSNWDLGTEKIARIHAQIDVEVALGKAKIDAAETTEKVTSEKEAAIANLVLAQKKTEAKDTLDEALALAKAKADETYTDDAERATFVKELEAKFKQAKAEIDAVGISDNDVEAAEAEIDAIVKKYVGDFKNGDDKLPEPGEGEGGEIGGLFEDELTVKKANAKAELEAYAKQMEATIDARGDLTKAEKDAAKGEVAKVLAQYAGEGGKIDQVKVDEDVIADKAAGEAKIDALVAEAKNLMGEHADKLHDKRVAAKAAVQTAYTNAEVDGDVKTMLEAEMKAAEKAIDAAKTAEEIDDIVAGYKAKVEEAEANGALALKKDAARKELEKHADDVKKGLGDLGEDLKKKVLAQIEIELENAKKAIDAAAEADIDAVKQEGKDAISLTEAKVVAKATLDEALAIARTKAEKRADGEALIAELEAKVAKAKDDIDAVTIKKAGSLENAEKEIRGYVEALVGDFEIGDDDLPSGEGEGGEIGGLVGDELSGVRLEAKAELEAYVEELKGIVNARGDIKKAEKEAKIAEIEKIRDAHLEKIDNAKSETDIWDAVKAAKNAMGDVGDKLYGERVEAKATLDAVLKQAETQLKDSKLSEAEQKALLAEFAEKIEAAKKKIDVAQSKDEIWGYVDELADGFRLPEGYDPEDPDAPTNPDLPDIKGGEIGGEIEDELAGKKAAAKVELEKYAEDVKEELDKKDLSADVIAKMREQIDLEVKNAKAAIEKASDEQGVKDALKAGKDALDLELVEKKVRAKQAIEEALEKAKEDIRSRVPAEEAQDIIDDLEKKAKEAEEKIDGATTSDEIDAILDGILGKPAEPGDDDSREGGFIDGVLTDKLASKKAAAKKELRAQAAEYEGVVSDEAMDAINAELATAIGKIEAVKAESDAEVSDKEAEIDDIVSKVDFEKIARDNDPLYKAKQEALQEIEDALQDALDNLPDGLTDEERKALEEQLKKEAEEARKKVEEAKDPKDVEDVLDDVLGEDDGNGNRTGGTLDKVADPEDSLAGKRASAKEELDRYAEEMKQAARDAQKDDNLTEDDVKAIEKRIDEALAAAKKAIDDAESGTEIDGIVTEVKAEMKKTSEDTLAGARERAKKELQDSYDKAKDELDKKLENKEIDQDEYDKALEELEHMKKKGEEAIDDADSEDGLKDAEEEGKGNLGDIASDPGLAAGKNDAKKELEDEAQKKKDDLDKKVAAGELSQEEADRLKDQIDEELKKALEAVDGAKNPDDVKGAVDSAKKDINKAGTPAKTKKVGGLVGGVVSVAVVAIALIAVLAILGKRKKKNG